MTSEAYKALRFRVRGVEAPDEEAWRRLWQGYCDFYEVTISPDITDALWLRIMDKGSPLYALVAEATSGADADSKIVGFANYILHPYTWGTSLICYLEDLFVSERWRGHGAGSALIESLIDLAKRNGWPRIYWHTHERNALARSLYEKFTPVDPFVRYLIRID